jgi:hypothetical protein
MSPSHLAPPDSGLTQGRSSLEVRWIIPGRMQAAIAGWFSRFPVEASSREDMYLLHPQLPAFSVKVRAGRALEVKVYRGSPGVIDVPGRALGRMELWTKWSWPYNQPGHQLSMDGTASADWMRVCKWRRASWFPLAGGQRPGAAAEPGVTMELTEIGGRGGMWWSLGFEATGPDDLLRRQLEATTVRVFSGPMPGGVAFGPDDSCSYAEWLGRASPLP